MQAFSNENIKDKLCGGCDCNDFAPDVTYAYDANAKTVTITDDSVYPAGDGQKVVHFSIHDGKNTPVKGSLPTNAGAVDVSSLDASDGLDILATVVTDKGCISDGHASKIGAAGSLGSWDKDNDSLTIGSNESSS